MAKVLMIVMLLGAIEVSRASAALVVFTDEAEFLAATGPLSFEGFEETEPGLTGSSRVLAHFIIGPVDADTSVLEILDDPAFASEGTQSAGGNTAGMFMVFDAPITALGFTLIDFGNAGSVDTLELALSLFGTPIGTVAVAVSSDPFEAVRFFGVISTEAFLTAELRKTAADDFFAVDAVHSGLAQPVPEPSTLLLAALGVGLVVCAATSRGPGRAPASGPRPESSPSPSCAAPC